jgi:hypothetical protein
LTDGSSAVGHDEGRIGDVRESAYFL